MGLVPRLLINPQEHSSPAAPEIEDPFTRPGREQPDEVVGFILLGALESVRVSKEVSTAIEHVLAVQDQFEELVRGVVVPGDRDVMTQPELGSDVELANEMGGYRRASHEKSGRDASVTSR